VLDTPEQGAGGRRIFVRGFRPVTDASAVYGSLLARDTVATMPLQTTETLVNALGFCPQRKSTRYARGRLRIPAGSAWTFAAGVDPDFALDGWR